MLSYVCTYVHMYIHISHEFVISVKAFRYSINIMHGKVVNILVKIEPYMIAKGTHPFYDQ